MKADRRAVAFGGLVGAALTFAVIVAGSPWVNMVVVAAVVVSPVAGAVAASASSEGTKPFHEGGFAAVLGLVLGVGGWMLAVAFTSPVHPADDFLLLFPFAFLGVSVGFPFTFFIGGVAGDKTLMTLG